MPPVALFLACAPMAPKEPPEWKVRLDRWVASAALQIRYASAEEKLKICTIILRLIDQALTEWGTRDPRANDQFSPMYKACQEAFEMLSE